MFYVLELLEEKKDGCKEEIILEFIFLTISKQEKIHLNNTLKTQFTSIINKRNKHLFYDSQHI